MEQNTHKEIRHYAGAAGIFLVVVGLLLFLSFNQIPTENKDLFYEDKEGGIWMPSTVNLPNLGMVFANGPSKDDWYWSAVKSVPVISDEDKEKYKKNHRNFTEGLNKFLISSMTFLRILYRKLYCSNMKSFLNLYLYLITGSSFENAMFNISSIELIEIFM